MTIVTLEKEIVEDFLLDDERKRFERIKRELEVVATTLRSSYGHVATTRGEEILTYLKDAISDCLSEVESQIRKERV